jgi:hypothetical protein
VIAHPDRSTSSTGPDSVTEQTIRRGAARA